MTQMSPAETVFFAALAKVDPAERAAYLTEACGTDTELRRQVDRLLAAHPEVGSFLQDDVAAHPSPLADVGPGVRGGATVDVPITERPGTVIGPHKLLEMIGEGGMGTVWMALAWDLPPPRCSQRSIVPARLATHGRCAPIRQLNGSGRVVPL